MACLVLICQSRLERKTVKRKRVFATLKVLGSVLGQLTDELPEEVRSTVFSNIILFMAAHTLIFQLLILWTISGLFWEFELLCFFQATIFFSSFFLFEKLKLHAYATSLLSSSRLILFISCAISTCYAICASIYFSTLLPTTVPMLCFW